VIKQGLEIKTMGIHKLSFAQCQCYNLEDKWKNTELDILNKKSNTLKEKVKSVKIALFVLSE
jgi:hypothetical protein